MELFPSLLLVAVCRVEKCSATGAKRSSYRTCLTLREKVVCRECCRKLIYKSVVVKWSLLYLFNYWFNTGINLLGNQCVVTEEIALSTLNLSLFLWTFARSESYIKKWHWSTHKVRESFWAVVLANFKHCFDLTIIKIIIPLYNTVNTIVFESRETLWIALYLSLFRETFVTNYCL